MKIGDGLYCTARDISLNIGKIILMLAVKRAQTFPLIHVAKLCVVYVVSHSATFFWIHNYHINQGVHVHITLMHILSP